jgi:hypothetical protein
MTADLGFQDLAKEVSATMAHSNSMKQVSRIAAQVETMLDEPSFQQQVKTIDERMEELHAKATQSQASIVAEQIEGIMASPSLKEHVKGLAKQISMMKADPRFYEQARRVALLWERAAQQGEVDLNFREQAKLVTEQMEAMMADPNIQDQARRAAEALAAGPADPDPWKERAGPFAEQVHVMLSDDLMDRALGASHLHPAGLDQTTLAKSGHLPINSRTASGPHSGATSGRRWAVLAKPGQIRLRTSVAPFLPSARGANRYNPSSRLSASEVGSSSEWVRQNASAATAEEGGFDLRAWLDPNTRGGVIVWGFVLFLVPYLAYQFFVAAGVDESQVGVYVGSIFVVVSNLLWASTYLFRVATKDMTYSKQLDAYEKAVMQKRLEEMPEAQLEALMADLDKEKTQKDGN